MSGSDSSSVISDESCTIAECLSNLSETIRELEVAVALSLECLPGHRGLTQDQMGCPLKNSRGSGMNVSRGCPFDNSGQCEENKQKDSELADPNNSLPFSELLVALPNGEELDLDVTVEDQVVVTSGQDKISDQCTRNVYHLKRSPDGTLTTAEVDPARLQSAHSALKQLPMFNKDFGATILPDLNSAPDYEMRLLGMPGRVMWEQSSEAEMEQAGRKVVSRENTSVYGGKASAMDILNSAREVRRKIKQVREDLEELTDSK